MENEIHHSKYDPLFVVVFHNIPFVEYQSSLTAVAAAVAVAVAAALFSSCTCSLCYFLTELLCSCISSFEHRISLPFNPQQKMVHLQSSTYVYATIEERMRRISEQSYPFDMTSPKSNRIQSNQGH